MREMAKEYSLVFGMTLVVNLYVLVVASGVFVGCDPFIKGLDGFGITAWIAVLLSGYLLCEVCMRYLGGEEKKRLRPCKVVLGMVIMTVGYLLAVFMVPSSGKDESIRAMSSFDFYLLVCVEFVFGTLMVFMTRFLEKLFGMDLSETNQKQERK